VPSVQSSQYKNKDKHKEKISQLTVTEPLSSWWPATLLDLHV